MKPVPFFMSLVAVITLAMCVPMSQADAPSSPCQLKGDNCAGSVGLCSVYPYLVSTTNVGCCEDLDGDGKYHRSTAQFLKYDMAQYCPDAPSRITTPAMPE